MKAYTEEGGRMAIADILAEAVGEIQEYLAEQPEFYQDWRPRLEKLLSEMDAIRRELDKPPK